ncbi:MAG TPA: 23S rRNA (pseudouridine(1915)-N(3))-methyltransferase RlmH [Nevskiaceae bacterium]|nr:23S rRNA (pseudouridine(1915)-N(3))-methyltransferase RlmH [Nevskiaceae bacterium]
MNIVLAAVGHKMPAWVQAAYADYAARLPRECTLLLREIAPAQRGKNADLARAKKEEGEKLLRAIPRDALVIALDERGRELTSTQWSRELAGWMQSGRDVALLIGGADGHASEVLAHAQQSWSLSKLTLPHAMVRVLVAEQLYRAWTLLANHPYHRA